MMYVSAGVSPEVSDVDGDYEVDTAEHVLVWHAGRVDASRRSGQLEFSVPSGGDDVDVFFPVQASFVSLKSYARAEVQTVRLVDTEEEIIFSTETNSIAEEYSVV
jgi:hypothetical protein